MVIKTDTLPALLKFIYSRQIRNKYMVRCQYVLCREMKLGSGWEVRG